MIAVARNAGKRRPAPAWHAQFLTMLPVVRVYARIAFRRAPPETKEELVQETICNCLVAFVRLIELGKGDLAFPGVLARFGIAQVRQGRRIGGKLNIGEVMSPYAQYRQGFTVDRLDHYDETEFAWQEILLEDRRCTPADLAASRIDFAAWLQRLPSRQRRIAMVLASGERTCDVAKRFRMSAGRISQLRNWLRRSWEAFQGETKPSDCSACAA